MNLYTITFTSDNHTLVAYERADSVKSAVIKAIKKTFNREDGYSLKQLATKTENIFTQMVNTALIKRNNEVVGYFEISGFTVA